MSCRVQSIKKNSDSLVDTIITQQVFKPISSSTVKKHLEVCHSTNEITTNLASLFQLNSINLVHSCILAYQLNNQIEINNPVNVNLVPQFIVRGFISLTYQWRTLSSQFLSGTPSDPQMLNLMNHLNNIFDYLYKFSDMKQPENFVSDFLVILKYFLQNTPDFSEIFFLSEDNPLAKFFYSFLSGLINHLVFFIHNHSFFVFQYLFSCFEIISYITIPISTDHKFYHLIPYYFNEYELIDLSLQEQIPSEILCQENRIFSELLIRFSSNRDTLDTQNKETVCYQILTFLTSSAYLFSRQDFSTIVSAIGLFIDWFIENFPIEFHVDEKTAIDEHEEPLDPSLIYTYFDEHSLLLPFTVSSPKITEFQKIIDYLAFFFIKISDHAKSFFDYTPQCTKESKVDNESRLKIWLIIMLSSNYNNTSIQLTDQFINKIMKPNVSIFNQKQLFGMDFHLFNVLMNFFYKLTCESGINRRTLFNSLAYLFKARDQNSQIFVLRFLPMLRSLLKREKSDFIQDFVSSKMLEIFQQIVSIQPKCLASKEIVVFIQALFYNDPNYISSQLITITFLTRLPQYHSIALYCFKIGLSLSLNYVNSLIEENSCTGSQTPLVQLINNDLLVINHVKEKGSPSNITPPANVATYICAQAIVIFVQSITLSSSIEQLSKNKSSLSPEEEESNEIEKAQKISDLKSILMFSEQLISLFSKYSLGFLPETANELSRQNFFETITQIPQLCYKYSDPQKRNSKSLLACLQIIESLSYYPVIMEHLNNGIAYKNLEKAFSVIPMDLSLFSKLKEMSVGGNPENEQFSNREALKLLVQAGIGTEFEKQIISFLLVKCQNNKSNIFECFSCDIWLYALKSCENPYLKDDAQELFEIIGSSYFSTYAINTTFRTIFFYKKKSDNDPYYQTIIQSILKMLNHETGIPVLSLFHFNGSFYNSGIFCKNLVVPEFSDSWVYSTSFRIDNLLENPPLFSINYSIQNQTELYVSADFETFNETTRHLKIKNGEREFSFSYPFERSTWYTISIAFSNGISALVVEKGNNRTKPEIIEIPQTKKKDFLSSKIPVTFDINFGSINNRYLIGDFGKITFCPLSEQSRSFITLDPSCADSNEHIIYNVNYNGDKAQFSGTAIPFCSTISSAMQSNGAIQKILSLFLLLKLEEDPLFPLLLKILTNTLILSQNMFEAFQQQGGFRLFTGLLHQIPSHCFSIQCLYDLKDMFLYLTFPDARHQMVECIWLNILIWKSLNYKILQELFEKIIPQLIISDPSSFKFDSYEFLVYQIQQPFDNLSPEEEMLIRSKEYSLFNQIFANKPSFAIFVELLSAVFNQKSHIIKLNLLFLISGYLATLQPNVSQSDETNKEKSEFFDALEVIKGTHYFSPLLMEKSEIQILAIQCMTSIVQISLTQQSFDFPTFREDFMASVEYLRQTNFSVENFIDLICNCLFGYSTNYTEFKFHYVLPLFCYICQFSKSNIFYRRLFKSLSLNWKLVVDIHSWPLWILILSNRYNSAENFLDPYISLIFSALQDGSIEPFLTTINFFDYLQDYANIGGLFLKKVLINAIVIKCSSGNKISLDIFTKVIASGINTLLFFKSSEVPYKSLSINEINKLIDDCSNYSQNPQYATLFNSKSSPLNHGESTSDPKFELGEEEAINESISEIQIGLYKENNENAIPKEPSEIEHTNDSIDKKLVKLASSFKLITSIPYEKTEMNYTLAKTLFSALISISNNNSIIILTKSFSPSLIFLKCFISSYIIQLSPTNEQRISDLEKLLNESQINSSSDGVYLLENVISSQNLKDKIPWQFNPSVSQSATDLFNNNFQALLDNSQDSDLNKNKLTSIGFEFEQEKNKTMLLIEADLRPIINAKLLQLGAKGYEWPDEKSRKFHQAFMRTQDNKINMAISHNNKLWTCFVRDATSRGGILAHDYNDEDIKWKATNRLDNTGQKIFFSENHHYQDHLDASSLRDTSNKSKEELMAITQNDMSEEHLGSMKNILNLAMSLSGSKSKQIQANCPTFSVLFMKIEGQYSGTLYIQENAISFTGHQSRNGIGDEIQVKLPKFIEIPIADIGFVFYSEFCHLETRCQIFTTSNRSYLFNFDKPETRTRFFSDLKTRYQHVMKNNSGNTFKPFINSNHSTQKNNDQPIIDLDSRYNFFEELRNACGGVVQNIPPIELVAKCHLREAWQNRIISTYQYLIYLNIISGRSFNDINTYPIFPWVLSDYQSSTLNLNDPKVYRNFSLPIAAMNKDRLNMCIDSMNVNLEFNPGEVCLYRSHFSSGGNIVGYLIREEPFTTVHIQFQSGKFDHASRLFFSIPAAWQSVSGNESLDYRELTPEFFCDYHFLINENHFNLGIRSDRIPVNDVILPPWASNAYDFINKNRKALESEYVSQHIHNWINLIFGPYQRSKDHFSLFHPSSYSSVYAELKDPKEKRLAQDQAACFGIFPFQLFDLPHPQRNPPIQPVFFNVLQYNQILPNIPNEKSILIFNEYGMLTSSSNLSLFDKNPQTKGLILSKMPKLMEKTFYKFAELVNMPDIKCNLLFFALNGSAHISVYNFSTEEELKSLMHLRANILCAALTEGWIITGGSDCSICFWKLPDLKLIATTSFNSQPITAIAADYSLNLCATIDVGKTIVIQSLSDHEFLHAFPLTPDKKSKDEKENTSFQNISFQHSNIFMKFLKQGILAVGEGHLIKFFDLRGKEIYKIDLALITNKKSNQIKIMKMELCHDNVLAVSFVPYVLLFFDGYSFNLIKNCNEPIIPTLIAPMKGDRRIIVVLELKNARSITYISY